MEKNKDIIYFNKIRLGVSELGGYGVFATDNIKKDELIEIGVMALLNNVDGHENPLLYNWSEDNKGWAIGTGYLHYYNHSETPNIKKNGDLKNNRIEVYALRDIKCGEELRGYYRSKKWRKCFQSF